MREQIEEILTQYGQMVTLRLPEGEAATRAFLQPVTEQNEQVPDMMTEIGSIDGRLWKYMGMTAVEPGDQILWNGMEFRVRSSRPYYIGETLLYWWASLERAKEAAQ